MKFLGPISRREFLKLGAFSLGALSLNLPNYSDYFRTDFPTAERLGRNCVGGTINVRSQPSADAEQVATLYEDAVVEWRREVVGAAPSGLISRKWIEIPEGYVYSPSIQPVYNRPNTPVSELPDTSLGKGMWAEVTVPYVDLILDNPPARAPWLAAVANPRLYYSQVLWVDGVKTGSDGVVYYRINERFGYGDLFWAEAAAFRVITTEEVSAITPDVTNKKVVVNLTKQYLTCLEGDREVYFCRCSTGAKFNAAGEAVDNWATPIGPHPINRKMMSIHMSGGSSGNGWDTPAIGWTCFFAQDGVAIHSCFWHNNFGVPVSHGCVNTLPEDSKWIYRWTLPFVSYDPGDLTIGMPGGTTVEVVE